MKQVVTVLGSIGLDDLGTTLMHEHLFIDITCWLAPPQTASDAAIAGQPVQIENLGAIRRNPFVSSDNLILDDVDMMIEEALAYRESGGQTIVDVTPIGIARDPLRLQKVARATGLNIICGTGYYVAASHPPDITHRSQADIADEMISELTEGIDGTGIRAGIIGEIGLSPGIVPDEEKVLRAAACASIETGAAITIHTPWPRGDKMRLLEILEQEGADLTRVIMGHLEYEWDPDLHAAIADCGAYLEYDCFGQQNYHAAYNLRDPLDVERVEMVATMIRRGYLSQILLSHDVANKIDTRRYGGWGYVHLTENVEPMFRAAGISDEQIRAMRVDNPGRVLPF